MDEKKFVEVKTPLNKKKREVMENWYRYCGEHQVPYIEIKSRTRYADIHWDYISYDTQVDSVLANNRDYLLSRVREIINNYQCNKTEFNITDQLFYINNIPVEVSAIMACEVYDLINEIVDNGLKKKKI